MKRLFVGVDTSNYTTSAALAAEDGEILLNIKKLLPVAPGERGLRQSDAVFLHTKAAPDIIESLKSFIADYSPDAAVAAVGYSYAPRDAEGSYMPCFLVGKALGRSIAFGSGVPAFEFSHQAGHVMAALYSAGALSLADMEFAAFHVSGGTTELLKVRPDAERIFSIEKAGGTLDISAGQLIDRVGVRLGFGFPAGRFVDEAALSYDGERDGAKICVKGLDCNLSGAENAALKIYDKERDAARTSAFVLEFVSKTLMKLTSNLREGDPDVKILYSGGVMSSGYIKKKLSVPDSYFASAEFSSDNAAGTALLALEKYKRSQKGK
jgi:N6-L-threonylcarbamoyladenine synthase